MLEKTIAAIAPLDAAAMEKCQMRLDNLTKPLNSLLYFERLARQLAGITGNPKPSKALKKSILLLAGPEPDELSAKKAAHLRQMIKAGLAPVSLFAQHVDAAVALVDVPAPVQTGEGLTREQAADCLAQGIRAAQLAVEQGTQLLGVDVLASSCESAGAAIVALYSGQAPVPEKAQQLAAKLRAVGSDLDDPLMILAALGDPVIAALSGVLIGAAAAGAAIVLDGVATNAAALLAIRLAPQVKDYLIGSHLSADPAHQTALELIGLPAHLDLELSIGQGVGATLGMVLVNAALHVVNDMKTFGEAGVAVAQDGPGALRQSHAVRD